MAETPEPLQLHAPWLVAVWPGMGHVGLNAGFYLAAKLEMGVFAEFAPQELFDLEHVDVENGLIRPGRLPRSRLFLWRDPAEKRDLVLFIGEAQPPLGKRAFCRGLLEVAKRLNVERIFTFAAMATQMHPSRSSHVYVAATDVATLDDLSLMDVKVLREGTIGGLNGVLLGEAVDSGIHGACLLGEMPHFVPQIPYPGGSLAVLKIFCEVAGLHLDLAELEHQAEQVSQRLTELLEQMEGDLPEIEAPNGELAEEPGAPQQPRLSSEDELKIERLFDSAQHDRSKAYELKQELDRLGVFAEYEDRFLDLFKKPEA